MRSSNPDRIFRDIERSIERAVDALFSDINRDSKKITPIRTGYAKSQWRKVGKYRLGDSKTMVENLAPYIAVLDQGSSRQAPNGIVQPTLDKLMRRRTRL